MHSGTRNRGNLVGILLSTATFLTETLFEPQLHNDEAYSFVKSSKMKPRMSPILSYIFYRNAISRRCDACVASADLPIIGDIKADNGIGGVGQQPSTISRPSISTCC